VPLRHWDSGNAATARARSSSALRATPSLQAAMPAVGFRKRCWHVEHSYAHTLPGNTRRKSAAVNLYHSTGDCTVGNHTVQSPTARSRHVQWVVDRLAGCGEMESRRGFSGKTPVLIKSRPHRSPPLCIALFRQDENCVATQFLLGHPAFCTLQIHFRRSYVKRRALGATLTGRGGSATSSGQKSTNPPVACDPPLSTTARGWRPRAPR